MRLVPTLTQALPLRGRAYERLLKQLPALEGKVK